MKQTAVEWLAEQLDNYFSQAQKEQTLHLVEIAKQMEKEQIKDAWMDGMEGILHEIAAEKYYNETYEK